jgi:hypothetical protein
LRKLSRVLLARMDNVENLNHSQRSPIDNDVIRVAHKLMGSRHPTTTIVGG